MPGATPQAHSTTFNYASAATANVFSLAEYYSTIVVDNGITTAAITLSLTTDGSNPTVGAGTGTVTVPPLTQSNFANLPFPPNTNRGMYNNGVDGTFSQSQAVNWTAQGYYSGAAFTSYTSTLASPAVFTSARCRCWSHSRRPPPDVRARLNILPDTPTT